MFRRFSGIERILSSAEKGKRLVFCGEGDGASRKAVALAQEKGILSSVIKVSGEDCLQQGISLIREEKADILLNGTLQRLAYLDLSLSELTLFEDEKHDRLVIVSGSIAVGEVGLPRKLSALREAVELSHKLGNAVPEVVILTNKKALDPSDQASVDAFGLSSFRFEDCGIRGPADLKGVFREINEDGKECDVLVESENNLCRTIKGTIRLFNDSRLAALYLGAGFPLLPGKGESGATVYNSLLTAVLAASQQKELDLCGQSAE